MTNTVPLLSLMVAWCPPGSHELPRRGVCRPGVWLVAHCQRLRGRLSVSAYVCVRACADSIHALVFSSVAEPTEVRSF